jgi:hypothetical protein
MAKCLSFKSRVDGVNLLPLRMYRALHVVLLNCDASDLQSEVQGVFPPPPIHSWTQVSSNYETVMDYV